MPEQGAAKRCPTCGEGVLVEISYRSGSTLTEDEAIQESDTRQVVTYSCGHEVAGPPLDRTAAGSEDLEVERRGSGETVDPT